MYIKLETEVFCSKYKRCYIVSVLRPHITPYLGSNPNNCFLAGPP